MGLKSITLDLEIDIHSGNIITASGSQKLDFKTRTFELLQNQPLDAAYYLHSEIYKSHPHLDAVCHTHSKYVSILSSLEKMEILLVHQNSCRFLKNVKIDEKYNGISTSQSDEGKRIDAVFRMARDFCLIKKLSKII